MSPPTPRVPPLLASFLFVWALGESLAGWPYAVGLVVPALAVGALATDRARWLPLLCRRSVAVVLALSAVALSGVRLATVEQGLAASYRTERSGGDLERSVDQRGRVGLTRVDRELSFDEEERSPFARRWPIAFLNHRRYAIQWDRQWPTVHLHYPDAVERFRPSPRFRPVFDVTWRGVIVPARSGAHVIRADGGLRARFEFEGQPAARGRPATQTVDLVAGEPYELSIRSYQGPAEPTHFELLWGPDPDALEPVPSTALFPSAADARHAGRARIHAFLVALTNPLRLLLIVGALAALVAARPRNRLAAGFLGVTALALALRLVVHGVYFAQPHSGILQGFLNDDYLHWTFAQRILLDDPWAPRHPYYWAPLYRYFLAGVQLVVGEDLRHVVLVQNVLGALTCGLAYRIGHRVHSAKAGWAAGLLCAFYPFLAYYEWTTYIAAFATFAATLAVDRAVAARALPSGRNLVLAGVATAVAILARPNLGLFLIFVGAWFALSGGELRTRLRRTALYGAAAATTILPFSVRNYVVGGEPVALTSNGAVNVYVGNNPDADGTYRNPPADVDPERFIAIARDFVLQDTGAWLALEGRKLSLLLAERQLWPALGLGAIGFALAVVRRERRTLPVSAMAAGVLVVPILFFVHDRFLVPGIPALAVLGGIAISAGIDALRRRLGDQPVGRPLAILAVVLASVGYVTVTAYGTAVRNRVQAPWNLGGAAPIAPWVIGDHR